MEERPNNPDRAVTKTAGEITECWSTIGVLGGDHSCAELERYTHCRNCPIHGEAGAKLLDRALPPGYREAWTRRLAQRKAEGVAGKKSAVIFRLGGEWLALPTNVFQEVAERRVIHSLPHQHNDFILGLANVRGELLLCFSLARFIGLSDAPGQAQSARSADRLLVVGWHGCRQAFPVDEVFGVHRFQPQEVKDAPALTAGGGFTRGLLDWEGQAVTLLDEAGLFETFNQNLA